MMSRRYFDTIENAELRAKIDEAKRRLPLPQLMGQEGLGNRAKKRAHCPFHDDEHESFSVYQGADGFWHYKCFTGCGEGDEIMFLRKLRGLSSSQAMNLYLSIAGFTNRAPRKSPECPESPEFPVSPVYPVSNGQGLDGKREKMLKTFAARNACTECNTARKRLWKLVRDLREVEKGIGRELEIGELMSAFDEWHRLSAPFLDPAKTRDDYLAEFLGGLPKVRVPTGDGDTLNKSLKAVSKLTNSDLPVIPGLPDAAESWRRLLALHRELSSRSTRKDKTYFLSYRDATRAHGGLSHQLAYDITLAFDRLGIIKIVDKGKARPSGGKATEFRCLLPQTDNGLSETEGKRLEIATSW